MIRFLTVAVLAVVVVLAVAVWLAPGAVVGVPLVVVLAARGRRMVRAEVKRQQEVSRCN